MVIPAIYRTQGRLIYSYGLVVELMQSLDNNSRGHGLINRSCMIFWELQAIYSVIVLQFPEMGCTLQLGVGGTHRKCVYSSGLGVEVLHGFCSRD